ncbi:ABC transporter substrate-binding protein [Azoarcus taiwanensis]|uniref:ABC transporter substrate-binding protein n=1 Tax=Azoarcus taiwanensis TaxID=666964 RepID=A0A972F6R2_9RHOO|nr:ABC transporter substrate-binding protein [Azoarcus taiwanensis]NMG02503.1 ABC transporter substrate-binding protein [Azoarcus taiwanensis]
MNPRAVVSDTRRRLIGGAVAAGALVAAGGWRGALAAEPLVVGIDAEFGDPTSTSAIAIRRGVKEAAREINDKGGLLGGRPLVVMALDNRSLPARGLANLRQFAATPNLLAYLCGKFSPVTLEQIPLVHDEKIILLNPWSAADSIADNGRTPNFAFRVGLRDSWAMGALLDSARDRGLQRVGLILPTSAWGRSCKTAVDNHLAANHGPAITMTEWHHWGDATGLAARYAAILASGAEAVILVANEPEGAALVKTIAALPQADRLPVLSHWGVAGGPFAKLCGTALHDIDFSLVQTFSFARQTHAEAVAMIPRACELFGVGDPTHIDSVGGFAHAYDLVQLLARAVERAGTTDRNQIREALLQPIEYRGLTHHYAPAFAAGRQEALSPDQLFMARFHPDGRLLPLET